ncbi:MAG: proline--tRNA ligase [Nanoarchaeota archaeon]
MSKENKEGLTIKKEEDFSEWFQQLVIKSELADYSAVSGCMVFKPKSWNMWEKLRDAVDVHLKKIGVKNVYFPLLIPESLLKKEAEHVAGFSPEVAWVTQAGNTKLNERLAVRPTSEAIMYESFSKWIRSWRDLPLKYNQWSNVVRWEFNNPILFFRTREFIFNEGHTVFASEKEALNEAVQIKKMYENVCEELMALPGIYGRKTEKEKFAGAVFTEKFHYAIPGGKIIEGPAFHFDGQNFAKAYNIKFLDKKEKEDYAWQNTWAISTRMLGTMFAIHSDNKGLVIPPRIADEKIVIIPILFEETKEKILKEAEKIKKELDNFNPILDDREDYSPGWKFSEWELKGIPLRIEIGPKDLEKKSITIVKRNTGEKLSIFIKDLKKEIPIILEQIQQELFKNAEKILNSSIEKTEDKKELIKLIKNKKMVMIPLSNSKEAEDLLKTETGGAKTLFIDPKNTSVKGKKCLFSGKQADYWVYVGKTY